MILVMEGRYGADCTFFNSKIKPIEINIFAFCPLKKTIYRLYLLSALFNDCIQSIVAAILFTLEQK